MTTAEGAADAHAIEQAIADLNDAQDRLRSHTLTSRSRSVEATVNGRGDLLRLSIADGALHRSGHALREVERDLVAAITQARTEAYRLEYQAVAEVVAPSTGEVPFLPPPPPAAEQTSLEDSRSADPAQPSRHAPQRPRLVGSEADDAYFEELNTRGFLDE
ncbi:DNA-binding protein YbaB [Crossiella equi]|uniref:DNA-binding protein YbaB n=2 Tax=Crossiella equi TaxID=130796 RepID=A0ABS5AN09_9PSEU|nr:DNA-binding protein YbaB [Crossiella equi]